MSVYWLVYTSKLQTKMSFEIVKDIISKSRVNNARNNVTGILAYRNNRFFQCLEGAPDALNQIYHRLLKDTRHTDLTLLYYNRVQGRLFEEWSMYSLDMELIPSELRSMMDEKYNPEGDSLTFPEDPETITSFLYDLRFLGRRKN